MNAASIRQEQAVEAIPSMAATAAGGIEQALVKTIHRQAGRIPVPVLFAALVIGSLAAGNAPPTLVAGWVVLVFAMQILRVSQVRSTFGRPACSPDRLLRSWTALSAVNGVAMAASLGFSPYMDDVERSAHSMVLIGLTAGSVGTSHGYRPMYLAYAAPVFIALMLAWAVVPGDLGPFTRGFVVILVGLLGLVMRDLARDAFAAFAENIRINAELERALQAEQFANSAKTRFLAAASHDLRQPLHTLSLLSAALAMRPLDAKSASIARSMNEAMADLSSELDSLLDISKLDAGVVRVESETFEVGPILMRIVASMLDEARRKRLGLSIGSLHQACVRSDRALLERVVRNLLDNAVKYTEVGGIVVGLSVESGRCVISVADTGAGIVPEEQDRIFDEFYQVGNVERDRRKGLGLGLSIVRRLVTLLDGTVTVDSKPGEGSCFRISLASVAPDPAVVAVPIRLPTLAMTGLRILLLEDDIAVRAATRALLEELGCIVAEAGTVQEALDIATAFRLDLVLADIRLPGGESGLVAIERLRQIDPSIRCLLVSGETEPARLLAANQMGLIHLVKPVDQATLVSAIMREIG